MASYKQAPLLYVDKFMGLVKYAPDMAANMKEGNVTSVVIAPDPQFFNKKFQLDDTTLTVYVHPSVYNKEGKYATTGRVAYDMGVEATADLFRFDGGFINHTGVIPMKTTVYVSDRLLGYHTDLPHIAELFEGQMKYIAAVTLRTQRTTPCMWRVGCGELATDALGPAEATAMLYSFKPELRGKVLDVNVFYTDDDDSVFYRVKLI